MGRTQRGFRNALRMETLESRQLFASDVDQFQVIIDPAPYTHTVTFVDPDANTPQGRLAGWVSSKNWWSQQPTYNLQTFQTKAAVEAELQLMVSRYWDGLLGEPVLDAVPIWYDYLVVEDRAFLFNSLQPTSNWVMLQASTTPDAYPTSGLTNAQRVGVDEADVLEVSADGYLYRPSASGLSIVDLRDPTNLKVTQVSLEGGPDQAYSQLFLSGDRLVRISNRPTESNLYGTSRKMYATQTKVDVFDISDRVAPRLLGSYTADGRNSAARLVGDRLTLIQDNSSQLILPQPVVVKGDDGVERFESVDAYIARNRGQLLTAVMPDGQVGNGVAADIGTWEDVVVASDNLLGRTTIAQLDIGGDSPTLIDSELIIGLNAASVYVAEDWLYVYFSGLNEASVPITNIYRLATAETEVTLDSKVSLPIVVSSPRWISEQDGVLRVAGQSNQGADIYTVGDTDTGWKVLGKLLDIAPDQVLLSAYFEGERALVTTGPRLDGVRLTGNDPLHGIDFSDPAHPKELSELVIPGFTTYLHKIDETHWIGLGYENPPASSDMMVALSPTLQVSLYEADDLTDPKVLDRWVSTSIPFWPWSQIEALGVQFDPQSGLITFGSSVAQFPDTQGKYQWPVLRVDLDAEDPLQPVVTKGYPEPALRNFVWNDQLITVTNLAVIAQPVDDLTQETDHVFLGGSGRLMAPMQHFTPGLSKTFPVLTTLPGPLTILNLETSGGFTATIAGNDQITVTAPTEGYLATNVLATVRLDDGVELVVEIPVIVWSSDTTNPPTPPTYSDAHGKVSGRFVNDDGEEITDLREGDEAWVVLTAQDMRELGQGVFSAYFDVRFNSGNITVLGDVEFLGEFKNGRKQVGDPTGFTSIGAFGDATADSSEPVDIVRFRIRVDNDTPVSLTIAPSAVANDDFLLYGENNRINPTNVEPSVLGAPVTSVNVSGEAGANQDINGDGIISGLDALQIVNFINAQLDSPSVVATSAASTLASQRAQFDLNGDGLVSGVDVLQVVNTINARLQSGSGEGESSTATMSSFAHSVDQALSQLALDDWLKKGKSR